MLSRKVTCAIVILNELYLDSPNRRTGEKTIRRAELAVSSGQDSRTFRRVLQGLHQGRYLYMANSSITLTCDPSEVTIYDLFVSLHGGIPLGEDMEQDLGSGHYAEMGHPAIERLERDAAAASKKYFERKTLASVMGTRKRRVCIKSNITE